jgi:hypothetical protein
MQLFFEDIIALDTSDEQNYRSLDFLNETKTFHPIAKINRSNYLQSYFTFAGRLNTCNTIKAS